MQKLDVAILGGGPGGLSAAIALQRACRKLNVKVFERVPAITPRGAGLRLEVNGAKALVAIDPALYKAVADSANNPKMLVQFNEQGEVAFEAPLAPAEEKEQQAYGYHNLYLGWSDLQQLLADHLSPGTLQLGAQFRSFNVEDDGVLLEFDGSIPPVKAQVVIGCDGYMSKMRRLWLNDESPQFSGVVIWRGRISADQSPMAVDRLVMDMRRGMATVAYPGPKGHLVWNAMAPTSMMEEHGVQRRTGPRAEQHSLHARDRDDVPGTELKERVMRVFSIQPQLLRDVIAATDPNTLLEHDICFRPAATYPGDNRLGSGPITLAGDAAHVIRPTGQGANQALEDALELGRVIAEGGPTEESLRQYEAARMERWRLSAAISEAAAAITYGNKGNLTLEEFGKLANKEEAERLLWGVEMRPLLASATGHGA